MALQVGIIELVLKHGEIQAVLEVGEHDDLVAVSRVGPHPDGGGVSQVSGNDEQAVVVLEAQTVVVSLELLADGDGVIRVVVLQLGLVDVHQREAVNLALASVGKE